MAIATSLLSLMRWWVVHLIMALLSLCTRLGRIMVDKVTALVNLMAVSLTVCVLMVRRSTWTRPVREVLMRQLLFTGVDSVPVAIRVAIACGLLLVVEAAIWLDKFGTTTEMVAPILLSITVHDLAPLIASLAVIGRSGIAISTELASMKVFGELDVLESLGVDPLTYLIVPRVVSVVVSVFALAMVIMGVVFLSGYVVGLLMDVIHSTPYDFFDQVVGHMELTDSLYFVSKTVITGLLVAVISCLEGVSVGYSATEVPRVASLSGVHAMTAVFAINALLSLLVYGRVLIFQVL